jgi:hypothetical protein
VALELKMKIVPEPGTPSSSAQIRINKDHSDTCTSNGCKVVSYERRYDCQPSPSRSRSPRATPTHSRSPLPTSTPPQSISPRKTGIPRMSPQGSPSLDFSASQGLLTFQARPRPVIRPSPRRSGSRRSPHFDIRSWLAGLPRSVEHGPLASHWPEIASAVISAAIGLIVLLRFLRRPGTR